MRTTLFGIVLLAFFAPQKSCQVVSPQDLQRRTEDSLRDYFPKVRAHVYPQQELIVAITCTTNVGDKFVVSVQEMTAKNPSLQQLQQLRMASAFGAQSYKLLAIGFEQGMVVYNTDTNLVSIDWRHGDAQYQNSFRQECNQTDPPTNQSSSESVNLCAQITKAGVDAEKQGNQQAAANLLKSAKDYCSEPAMCWSAQRYDPGTPAGVPVTITVDGKARSYADGADWIRQACTPK